jgi:CopG family nickel-responsive transcriptional regulator
MGTGVTRFSVSVDPGLLEDFDELIENIGYNRSTAVQVAMRDFITEHKWSEGSGEVTGAITYLYEHHVRGLNDTLNEIQHHNLGLINSTTHVHLDKENCLEILAVKGKAAEIKALTDKLAVIRGIKQIRLSLLEI